MPAKPVPTRGAARPIPCVNCIKDQVRSANDDADSDKSCCDQITPKNKAKACFQCWEKRDGCVAVDADDPYVKAWFDIQGKGPAADPIERWETACRLYQHLQRPAAASKLQQSCFRLVAKTTEQLTKNADLLEGLFERSVGDLAAYSAHLPAYHPLSAEHDTQGEDEQLQDIKKCKTLDDMLAAVSDLSSSALDEVGEVHAELIAAVRDSCSRTEARPA
ncbi:hypothetical protein VSDG_01042 [Cytospora chrysosperma]|uniref:Uncharacterized protein n=1 Tax=Cytospora chrysosperma TaxID=252740 RepID=A0A423WKM8_CYTCH|nr:hypothetical protein VSDG_01042 [Valsa sordida]